MIYEMIISEMGRNRMRSVLTIAGIAIGILLVITLSSFSRGIEQDINNNLKYMSGLVTVVQNGVGFQNYAFSRIDNSIVDELADMPGVEEVAPIIFTSVSGFGPVMGMDPEHFDMFSGIEVGFEEGRELEKDTYEIMLGYDLAKKLRLDVGDYVDLNGKKFEVVGIFKKLGTEDDNGAMVSLERAREISGMDDAVSVVMIKPENVEDAKNIANDINEMYDEIRAASDEDIRKYAAQLTSQLNALTFAIGGVAAFIAGIVIMNVMVMSVRERRREIGIMKAIGASNVHILSEIILEAIFISTIGACIGIISSFIAVDAINTILSSEIAIITPGLVIEAFVFASIIGLVAGIVPARQAAKLDPVVAIRYE